tara:strand:- start:11315 stop:11551 length:237 start_codon:yes stop_codon:yes gene_type:complete
LCIHVQEITELITFSDALDQLPMFIQDTFADLDMAYDWLSEMTGIDRICDSKEMWHEFYECYYEAATWEQIKALHESV